MKLKSTDIAEGWDGFCRRLRRKGFSRKFIETHGEDLYSEAQLDVLKLMAKGEEVHTPPALLIHCGWRRTQHLLDRQRRRPRNVSLEAFFDLPDDGSSPAENLLTADLQRRMRKAMSYLLPPERELMELIYFQEMDCREAGRRLGWSSSKAHRKHKAALGRLRPFFERTL